MSLWRQFSHGVRVLRNRRSADQEVDDEVRHYLEESTAALVARGLSPDDARRAARLELGSATAVREQVRDYGWENVVDALFADLRYAVRRLRQKPGFAIAAMLTVALGIGATSAIFSVINGVLLKPLPYPQSEQIVALRHTAPGIHIDDMNMAASLYFTYSEENRVFQDVGMYQLDTASVTGLAEPEEIPALLVTNRFLRSWESSRQSDARSQLQTTIRKANGGDSFGRLLEIALRRRTLRSWPPHHAGWRCAYRGWRNAAIIPIHG